MVSYSSVLKPAMLFAAGSIAGTANAATTVNIPFGSDVSLLGNGTVQYRFNDSSGIGLSGSYKTKSSIVGVGTNTIAQNASTTPLYPTSADGSQYDPGVYGKGATIDDGYYGIRFSSGKTNYGGYLQVANNGTLISSYDYKVDGAASAVPEPESWALMIVGLAGVGAMLRRSRRTARATVSA